MKIKIRKVKSSKKEQKRISEEMVFTKELLDRLDDIDKDKIFSGAETREMFGLNPKRGSVKANFKKFYRWAATQSKKKGFSRLMEADVIRLVRDSRDSLDTFEPCTQ